MDNSHQHFEKWLFSEEKPVGEEAQVLQAHLQTCDACRQLSLAWENVESELRQPAIFSPALGFTDRWQARLAQDRLRHHRRQSLAILVITSLGSVFMLLTASLLLIPFIKTPIPILWVLAYQLVGVFSVAATFGEALLTIVKTLAGLIPTTMWVAILVALSSLGALWIVSIKKLTFERRVLR